MSETKFTPGPWFVSGDDAEDCPPHRNSGLAQVDTGTDAWPIARLCEWNNARLIAAAPDLLAEIEREYTELSDIRNEWPGRNTWTGQCKLSRLRDLIAKATGRDERDVQDDYGMRAALAKATP